LINVRFGGLRLSAKLADHPRCDRSSGPGIALGDPKNAHGDGTDLALSKLGISRSQSAGVPSIE
jgi:hypothetical protein